jgi:S-adenosylmethionine hydrolase
MFRRPLISLTTDFGHDDPFVGVMKGVIYTINPHVNIVDLTHSIQPQNVQEAAFAIGMNYQYFPKDSIHLVVVDPEVGSRRRPLLVLFDGHYFIGPDNGVFSCLYQSSAGEITVIPIIAEHFFLKKKSPTFHARDVFSPCAAWLSTGLESSAFGEPARDYQAIPIPAVVKQSELVLQGEVIFIDRFGNAITNISRRDMDNLRSELSAGAMRIVCKDRVVPFYDYYAQAAGTGLGSVLNSSDYLEFFVYRGNAALECSLAKGDKVTVFLFFP